MRARSNSSRSLGTGSADPGLTESRSSALAISSAKNGLPPEFSWMRRRRGRGHERPRRARNIAWSAPRLSGPRVMRCVRSGDSARSKPNATRPLPSERSASTNPDRLLSETADGELERGSGRSVEPLQVVHDHQHPPRARALAQEGEEGRGHGTSVEWGLRLLTEQRDGQGAPLGRGKLRRDARRRRLRAGPATRRTTASTRDPQGHNGAPRPSGSGPRRPPRQATCSSRCRPSPR